MQDNKIKYQLEIEGGNKVVSELNRVKKAADSATQTVKSNASAASSNASSTDAMGKSANRAAGATDRASRSQAGYFAHIARTTVQSALINKLFLEFVDVSGQAVQQVDLMGNFPATMSSMNQSTKDATASMDALSRYVGMIGGNLGDATSMVTRFTGATKDVKAATAIFVGLNNALIAGDSSMEEQRLAATQFAQALERGKPDMREWMSLTQNMSFQLSMVAKEMGYVSANKLGEALRSGEVSMGTFTTELTKLSTGTGPIAQQAMARMNGMQFAFNVMKNTMVQGLAAIINAFGRTNIVSFFTFLTQVIQVLTGWVVKLIGVFITLLNLIGGLFGLPKLKLQDDVKGVADGIGDGADNAGDLGDGLADAGKEAKKLNKSLAGFDKMNVLPDKESASGGGKDKGGGGGAGFDAGEIGDLGNLFDGITGKIQEAGKWAKILGGVLVGLMGIKFAQAIADQFNGLAKTIDTTSKNLDKFKEKLTGGKEGPNIFARAKTSAIALAGSVGALIGSMGKMLLNPWVLLAIAIAAVVAGLVYLYNTNEDFKKGFDSVWSGIGGIVQGVANTIGEVLGKAIENVKKMFEGLPNPLKDALAVIGGILGSIGDFFSDLAEKIGLTGPPMEQFGKFVGILSAALAVGVGLWAAWNIAVGIANIVTGIFGTIMAVITSPIFIVIAAIIAIIAVIVLLVAYWDEIVKVAGNVWQGIVKIWNGVAKWFGDKVVKPIVDVFSGIWDGIVGAFTGIAEWVTTNVVDPIVGAFTWVWDGVVSVFTNIVDFLREWGLTILAVLFFPITFFVAGLVLFVPLVIGFFQAVWDGIVAVFSVVAEFFTMMFESAWFAIRVIWIVAVGFFRAIWDGIVAIFTGVVKWMGDRFKAAWEGIVAIWGVVSTWFDETVIQPIMEFFAPIVKFISDIFSNAWKNVTKVWSVISTWFGEQWGKVKNIFSGIGSWFQGVFKGAWDKITGIFGSLWSWFKTNVWDRIVKVFTSIGTTVADAISGAFKGVINTVLSGAIGIINGFLRGINWAIDTINAIPGVSIKKVPELSVPKLATGGVVDRATLAMIGEDGAEAVVPLENNLEWLDKLAAKINAGNRGDGQPIQLTVQVGEDKIASRIIDLINEKTQMSGRNTIYV